MNVCDEAFVSSIAYYLWFIIFFQFLYLCIGLTGSDFYWSFFSIGRAFAPCSLQWIVGVG